jgi:hypothetical protein
MTVLPAIVRWRICIWAHIEAVASIWNKWPLRLTYRQLPEPRESELFSI